MEATLTIKIADQLFDIAERLRSAERAGLSQAEAPRAAQPTAASERGNQATVSDAATSDAGSVGRQTTERASEQS